VQNSHSKKVSLTSFACWFFQETYNEHWVTMVTGQEGRFLEHVYVLMLNAGKNNAETGITVFTQMQDEIFLLNLALKYERSS